jgi:hypothetical protein
MADRLGAIGGELEVAARPGRGVRVRGWVPDRPDICTDDPSQSTALLGP